MSSTLIVLAVICAANPFRVAACAPASVDTRRQAVVVATASTLLAVGLMALLSDPILDLLNVSGSSSRIAAGVAVLIVGIRDLFVQPPSPEPALTGRLAGIMPMAFPTLFTPALVILAISAASARGVVAAFGIIGAVILLVGLIVAANVRGTYWRAAAVGSAGVVIGTLLTLNGVTAI
ncbi:MAG: hypothetical protein F4Y27_00545 [Acidimicrobiaceae bacterium]|nr:hypothetical protein [Acidimicrobiaceae bacterium]MXW62571.1 hypothetical protein [Acidimicrobiaceae bacterium]MXW75640.1 hypothetical protein [Acidimicrobiaceae bacterium]MYA73159.1 hypothetical protein [Acidimicrobiaceae bacterium]MYC42561.1 hypothetical protein [Acidimicrobiaceae bacterium]